VHSLGIQIFLDHQLNGIVTHPRLGLGGVTRGCSARGGRCDSGAVKHPEGGGVPDTAPSVLVLLIMALVLMAICWPLPLFVS